jgi:hypothetical protein
VDSAKAKEKLVSIGMWPERYRYQLDVIVSHRSYASIARVNRSRVLGEMVEKEFERMQRGEQEK